MEELIKFGYSTITSNNLNELMFSMETKKFASLESDKKVWFSMWFLSAIVTFGLAFFPMIYRLIKNRNHHFQREEILNEQVIAYLQCQGKTVPKVNKQPREMNAKIWTAAVIFVIPVFIIAYLLSKDLSLHEAEQDEFLAQAFPDRIFMTQTISIKTYAILTLVTLGFGVVYWLYKVVNQYNAHYKAHLQVEKIISSMMEEKKVDP
jgi:multisubunit Na+/H+ antiporter MnhF subunit